MRITVLGATGRTGRLVTEQALAQGHEIVAYVRRPEALEQTAGLDVVGGQLDDVGALTKAFDRCDAVVVAVGPSGLTHVTLMQRTVPNTIDAMKRSGVHRIAVQSAFGVGETRLKASVAARLVAKTMLRGPYRDHELGESSLPGSGLDWTLVYPVVLTDGPRSTDPQVRDLSTVDRVLGLPKVSRADVASALLSCLVNPETIGRRVLVG